MYYVQLNQHKGIGIRSYYTNLFIWSYLQALNIIWCHLFDQIKYLYICQL